MMSDITLPAKDVLRPAEEASHAKTADDKSSLLVYKKSFHSNRKRANIHRKTSNHYTPVALPDRID